ALLHGLSEAWRLFLPAAFISFRFQRIVGYDPYRRVTGFLCGFRSETIGQAPTTQKPSGVPVSGGASRLDAASGTRPRSTNQSRRQRFDDLLDIHDNIDREVFYIKDLSDSLDKARDEFKKLLETRTKAKLTG
ncbi:hypothetical protein JS562_54470, partial [Agrobacterium sp. S2]|nr:hypothetical protein [Agrobacterium sp. S2]